MAIWMRVVVDRLNYRNQKPIRSFNETDVNHTPRNVNRGGKEMPSVRMFTCDNNAEWQVGTS
jgi:hypothetical protein